MQTLVNGSFFGRAAPSVRVGGVMLTETSYEPRFVVPLHDHAHPIFCVGLAGHFTEQAARRRDTLGSRSVFFQPSGEPHAETFHEAPSRLFNVQLGDEWLSWIEPYGVRLPAAPISATRGRLSILGMQLHAEYRMSEGPLRLAVDGLLLSMIAELTRVSGRRERAPRPQWLENVLAMLHDRFRENVGLAELATVAGVDPSHLARTFRARTGCTTGEYVRALRLEHARSLLAGSDAPIARVAAESGFADQSHLIRTFRAVFGTTPAEYRRLLR